MTFSLFYSKAQKIFTFNDSNYEESHMGAHFGVRKISDPVHLSKPSQSDPKLTIFCSISLILSCSTVQDP